MYYWTGAKWAYDQGQWTSIMNECGSEAGLQSAMYAAGRVLGGTDEEMLGCIHTKRTWQQHYY